MTKNERLDRQLSEALETRSTLSPSEHSTGEGGEKCAITDPGLSTSNTNSPAVGAGGMGEGPKLSTQTIEEVWIPVVLLEAPRND